MMHGVEPSIFFSNGSQGEAVSLTVAVIIYLKTFVEVDLGGVSGAMTVAPHPRDVQGHVY